MKNFFLKVIDVIQRSVLLRGENIHLDNMDRVIENYLTMDFNSEKNRRSEKCMDFLRDSSGDIFMKLKEGKALQEMYFFNSLRAVLIPLYFAWGSHLTGGGQGNLSVMATSL